MNCQICNTTFHDEPFALADLSQSGHILSVCETCASSRCITVDHDGVSVTLDRDDYLRADKTRLFHAIENALSVLEDFGWDGKAMTLHAKSNAITDPLDE